MARLIGLVLLALSMISGGAGAHEIGTTQVRLDLEPTSWTALITTGPQSLVNKLEAEAHLPRSSDLDAAALRARLDQLGPVLGRQVEVRFDGIASPLSVSIDALDVPPDLSQAASVVLRLTGPTPAEAQTVTWRYGLSYSTYALIFQAGPAATPVTVWIEGDASSPTWTLWANRAPPTLGEVVVAYLRLGFLHIVPYGLDHILFVLGLFLLSTRLRPLLTQVTAFTLAHSLTLALTMYGVVSPAARVVEPMIALSIAYVAIENIATARLTPWRPALVFAFGLLHGMGFAGVLTELPLPRAEFVPALVSFNIGIELGQLAVIATAYFSVAAWSQDKWWYRPRVVMPASGAIAMVGLFWTVQRVLSF
jgi:hypothetical protein